MLDNQRGWTVLSAKYKVKGMTLVEILVAVVIVGILYAAAAPSFANWIQNTRIRSAAESIQNGLILAKTEAVHGNRTAQFVSCGGSSWDVIAASAAAAASGTACTVNIAVGWVGTGQSRQTESGANRALVDVRYTNGIAQSTIGFNGLGRQTQILAKDNIGGADTASPPVAVNINISALPTATSSCACPPTNPANCGYPAGIPNSGTGKLRCLRITVSANGSVRMCDPALPAFTPQGC